MAKPKKIENWPAILKAWRIRRAITQQRAADFFEVPISTYQRWEYGIRKFSTSAPSKVRDLFAD